MANEERDNEEGALLRRNRDSGPLTRAPLSRAVDLTAPRQERGRSVPPPPPGVVRTQPIEEDIRGYTAQITVTDTSKLLLPADSRRRFLFVQNNDTLGNVNLSFGVDATLATGMRLSANGGGILLDNNVPTAAVYVIGTIAANSNVTLISG